VIRYGLAGQSLAHSFSKQYFSEKFAKLGLTDHDYQLFEVESIASLRSALNKVKGLKGFNVTIPYKESILPYLDQISPEAKAIGAVNCVHVLDQQWIGYNTDVYGFSQSIKPFLDNTHERALILGTGGAAKAAAFALKQLGVEVFTASRNKTGSGADFNYEEINSGILKACLMVIHATPSGTFPRTEEVPPLPMDGVTKDHFLYDMVYNPSQTQLMKEFQERGATTMNGLSMLKLQADKSWEIWNSPSSQKDQQI